MIRCGSGISAKRIKKYFKARNIEFEVEEWEDNIPITQKYQKQFKDMFHSFSELAMVLEENDLLQVLERVCHCFLNNCYTKRGKILDICSDASIISELWETIVLQITAAGRAYTTGHTIGGISARKIKR